MKSRHVCPGPFWIFLPLNLYLLKSFGYNILMLPDGRKRGGLGLRKALAPVNRSSLAGDASIGATKAVGARGMDTT